MDEERDRRTGKAGARAVLAVWTGLAFFGLTAVAGTVADRVRRLPKLATACEGLVGVLAADVPGDDYGFRLPILQFVSRQVRDLERAYDMTMPRGEIGILVNVGEGRTNDTRVIVRPGRRPDGGFQTRIFLPSPGFSDLEDLREVVAEAYFRAWIFRHGNGSTNSLPAWVVQGAVRAVDGKTVDDDTRFVLSIWSRARLPFFPALCTDLRRGKGPAAALPGYLVAWMKEKKLLRAALDRAAGGKPWDGTWLAAELTGETDPVLQDRASDERLARLTRAVLAPGQVTDWERRVFTSRLLLYAPVFTGPHTRTCWTFDEAVTLAETSETIRRAAWQKSCEMPFYAIGRGEDLVAAADAYRLFLLAAAKGEPAAKLRPLLQAADARLTGVVLR